MGVDDLAKQAADSVREVIAEAERQAAEIIREARADAERIRAGAAAEARNAPAPATAAPAAPPTQLHAAESSPSSPDTPEAARLVALKMALDGSTREEVAGHLADEYGLRDSDALLDEVFARAGK
jgi:hypothetical protein